MDAAEYLPMFVAECRENLEELGLAIVEMEERPEDPATIDVVFRVAHSLKGMAATMGFGKIAALTHSMEDVFELLRARRGGVGREAIDVVLACLDALSATVDTLDETGTEQLDPAPLVERLELLVRSSDQGDATDAPIAPPQASVAAPVDRPVAHVVVEIAADAPMPAVRAFMVLEVLERHGEIVWSDPLKDEVEGFSGRIVDARVATEAGPEAILRSLDLVSGLADARVDEPGDEPSAPGPAVDVEAERSRADRGPRPEARVATGERRKGSATVRVDAERLDALMHLMGELVVQRTRLEACAAHAEVPGIRDAMQDLTRTSQALQAMVMQVRMIPVEAVFMRLPRLVRDLSGQLGKQVELALHGQETELDRSVVESLGDPLVHLVRNALDHGLEGPEERVAAGKPETGRLEISARHAGGSVIVTVADDGRGIDPATVARKAVERGLISADAERSVDMQRAVELIFSPGFSTSEQATSVSGRGVGMDAVDAMVRELRGDIVVTSQPGLGTTTRLRLPLTLAIMSALLVVTRDLSFALPLDSVERTLRLEEATVRSAAGRRMLVHGEGSMPLVDLAEVLGYGAAERRGSSQGVVVRSVDRRIALEVDTLVGQHELVTRSLPAALGRTTALSAGTVLASGDIALVVDCDNLVASAWTTDSRSARVEQAR